jgi:hypothetical protein
MHLSTLQSMKKLYLIISILLIKCSLSFGNEEIKNPVAITPDDGHFYWFGYYDKLLTDPKGRFVLAMRSGFEHRTPEADDVIQVGMIDLQRKNRWIQLGETRAWSWQQGCMLQFIPGSADEVIWNDRENDQFISRIINIKTMKTRTLPMPVYTLSPDGKTALGLDFARLQVHRPGYGYVGVEDKTDNIKAPDQSGIYRMNLETGESKLLVTPAQIVQVPLEGVNFQDYFHWFNHLLISPDGSRFIFLHRWHKNPKSGFITRMFTADMNGKDLFVLDSSGKTSHFIWKDNKSVAMFTRPAGMKERFYLFKDKTNEISKIGEDAMVENGHCTYVPGTNDEWMLNDTYPDKATQLQTLFLYNTRTGERWDIGKFLSPPLYKGEWRCDLHPWASADGKTAFFQSAHEGKGRRIYMVDISKIITKK